MLPIYDDVLVKACSQGAEVLLPTGEKLYACNFDELATIFEKYLGAKLPRDRIPEDYKKFHWVKEQS